jgi:protein PhnA
MPNTTIPPCPLCGMNNTYLDSDQWICPDCAHEWPNSPEDKTEDSENIKIHKDAHGNILQNGDTVTLIKDLKVKGSSLVIKGGTKIKNIRLVDGDHDIDCKVDGQSMLLKSEFMKKA